MTMITPSYLGETIEYSSLHACRSTLEDPTSYYVVFSFGSHRPAVRRRSFTIRWLFLGVGASAGSAIWVRSNRTQHFGVSIL